MRSAHGPAPIRDSLVTTGDGAGPLDAFPIRTDNDAGLVLEVGEGRGRALLMADVPRRIERGLGLPHRIAILKAGHHGSRTSSDPAFLARILPGHAVLSCGSRNPFGHPHAETLSGLAAVGAVLHSTAQDGAVWFACGRDGVRHIDWRHGPIPPASENVHMKASAITPPPRMP